MEIIIAKLKSLREEMVPPPLVIKPPIELGRSIISITKK
jgi:hypothetical protein